MNIKRELAKAVFRKDVQDRLRRAFTIVKNLICTHNDLGSEIVTVELGNSEDSIIAELFGVEAAKQSNKMYMKRIYCLNCGREISRYILDPEEIPLKEE